MKFKGVLNTPSINYLASRLLPAIEKFSKICIILTSPDEICFMLTPAESENVFLSVRLLNYLVFERGELRCESKADNTIGLTVDVPLLTRVLHNAISHRAQRCLIKLSQKAPASSLNSESNQSEPPHEVRPVLVCVATGPSCSLSHDLPLLAPPLARGPLDHLRALRDSTELCHFYVDLGSILEATCAMIERMRSLGDELEIATSQTGEFFLSLASPGISLGSHSRGLQVIPQDQTVSESTAAASGIDRSMMSDDQLRSLIEAGYCNCELLSLRSLIKAFQAATQLRPQKVLFGIHPQRRAHILLMFQKTEGDSFSADINVEIGLPIIVEHQG
mmetsp:Transcript_34110/g.61497  ORF Transcript_34110/g.61497 Transcript_34110/m.61497 type:complete len:333 (-) Transcript_34110:1515-2513(-)